MTSDLPELSDTTDETAENKKDKPCKPKRHWFTLFIAWMALFFTAIGIMAGYKNWLRIHDKTKENRTSIALITTQLMNVPTSEKLSTIRAEVLEKMENIEAQSSKELTRAQKYAQQSQHYAETIDAQVAEMTQMQARLQLSARPSTSKDWVLSETEFLIRMANRKLHLDKDKHSALVALRSADENLARLGSPHFLPVRQQIAKDITALEQYAEPNIAELSQQITSLMIKLEPLPANNQDISAGEKVELGVNDKPSTTKQNENNSLWSEVKGQAESAFKQAVVIRKHNKPIESDLDADSRLQLYNLLQLRLETLRLMVLQGLDKGFHQQIKLINTTLKQYYPKEKAEPLLEIMTKLNEHNLSPKKPNISSSLKQLESALLTENNQQTVVKESKK